MKKILAVLLACGLAMQTCAFASVKDLTVTSKDNTLAVDATVGTQKNLPVIVSVGDYGKALSATSMPEYMYLFRTGDDGALDLDVTLRPDIESGKYTVYVNAQDGSKDKKDVMVLNPNDENVGGTKDVMAAIGVADATALGVILADKAQTSKLGIDPDAAYPLLAKLAPYMGEVVVGLGLPVDTISNFQASYDEAFAKSALKSNEDFDAVMSEYATEFFGVDYEADIEPMSDAQKSYIASRLTEFDYTDSSVNLADAYSDILLIMDYAIANAWGTLRQLTMADYESGNIAFNMTAYDQIEATRQIDVFTKMKAYIIGAKTVDDIMEAFENASYEVYTEQINDDSEEEGSITGDSSWGGGTTSKPNVNPNGTGGNKLPAGGNSGDLIIDPTENKNDTPTEQATPAPTVPPTPAPGEFEDTMGHWAKDYIKTMVANGVVVGYDDGTFLPNKNVTRAEYIKMIVGQFALTQTAENEFGDVAATDWYAEYVNKAVAAGLVEGDGGNFRPNDTITRQDAAVILYRLGIKAGETAVDFADDASVADYAKDAVDTLASAGIINGSDGNFNPKNAITRAETAAILCRAADKVVADEEGTDEPAEAPVEGEDAETPAEGEDAETPAEGEDAETPAEGEDAETPAEGEDAETPAEGEDAETPAEGEEAVTEEKTEEKSEETVTE